MNKLIVIVFDTEAKVYEGLKQLQNLHGEDGFDVFATAVVAKDEAGKASIRQSAADGPWGAAAGLAIGSLIGALAGPAGLALGAAAGTLSGVWSDASKDEVDMRFLTDAGDALQPGKTAIVASIHETWVVPLDAAMAPLGGTVLRRARSEVSEEVYGRQVTALKAEIKQYETEIGKTAGEWRDKLQAKVDDLKKQLSELMENIEKRRIAVQREGEAQLKTLQKQADAAGQELKTAYDDTMAKMRIEYNKRVEQLKV